MLGDLINVNSYKQKKEHFMKKQTVVIEQYGKYTSQLKVILNIITSDLKMYLRTSSA